MKINDPRLQIELNKVNNLLMKGVDCINNRMYHDAIHFLTKAIEESTHLIAVDAYFNRASAYIAIGEYQKAINDYEDKVPNIGNIDKGQKVFKHTNLGYAHYKLGNLEEALKNYEIVLRNCFEFI